MSTQARLQAEARQMAALLKNRNVQIVFAESCTAGLLSATLGAIPGISSYLCGSAVVYQTDTKSEWLGISKALLRDPGPVSREVAAEMATRVLARTPNASVAVSVTGHLGPDAPAALDGLIFTGIAIRGRAPSGTAPQVTVRKRRLESAGSGSPARIRMRRQVAAALFVLETAKSILASRLK